MTLRRRRLIGKSLIAALVLAVIFQHAPIAQAAQVTSLRAVFRRLKASTATEGIVVTFATPTGIQNAAGDTITLTFSAGFTLAAEAAANFDIGLGDSGTCSTANYTDETVVLNTATATEWAVDVTGQVITFTPETDDTLTAGFCIRFEMGLDAATGGTGSSSTVTNGATGSSDTIVVGGAFADTGTMAIDIITDDQVTISATVDPTITFTLSADVAVGFGTLTTANGKWANAAASGATAVNGNLPTSAHQMTIATNAASGYTISYNGATLTSGANTITAIPETGGTECAGDSDCAPNSRQFGVSVSTDGNATIDTDYQRDTSADFSFVPSTTTTIISETVPTNTETIDVSYIANIDGTQPAGSYNTTVTYIATGTF